MDNNYTIANATTIMKILAVNHPYPDRELATEQIKRQVILRHGRRLTQTIPTGPAGSEKAIVDAIDGTRPIILNAIANICGVEYCRFNSCLYPILAWRNQTSISMRPDHFVLPAVSKLT